MIVPEFWAEARLQQPRADGRPQITVRRFGWSDTSQADAERMANERVREAFTRVVAGEKLPRREPKIGYNGATGVPIREEILSRHGDAVVTRNSYGARCLNTPDVVFADVDFENPLGGRLIAACAVVLLAAAVGLGVALRSAAAGAIAAVLALILAYPLANRLQRLLIATRGGPEKTARARIEAFCQSHPEWGLRLYRTPAGFRVLAMQATYVPNDPAVEEFFATLGVDAVYRQMCRNQACFRARLSPKPWRIGITSHLRPRPGVWPVNPARLPERNTWIRNYDDAAVSFAACRFVEAIGSSVVHPKAGMIRDLHDQMSQALSGRAIA